MIIDWLSELHKPPGKIFINHGEPKASEALAEKIRSTYNWEVVVPEMENIFSL
jgi:metallo-beta-lactamase family protein